MKRLVTLLLAIAPLTQTWAAPDRVLYDLGEKCGKQASAAFARDFGTGMDAKDGMSITNYRNHYNPRLNACLYLIFSTRSMREKSGKPSPALHSSSLFDLNEDHEIATFWSQDGNARVFECTVNDKKCASREEFDAAVNALMAE